MNDHLSIQINDGESNSCRTNSSASTSSEELQKPVLPWLQYTTNNLSQSTLHAMKQQSKPEKEFKEYKRWTWAKIWLMLMNSLLFSYGLIVLILGICTYMKLYQRALVIIVGEKTILNLVTATGVICLVTSLLGFVGLVLNHRPILAIYNIMMWPSFGMIAAIGYAAYRKNKWNIEGKLSYQWHYDFDSVDRANIQANLHCCGYKSISDFHEQSNKCYPRTLYPGCKFKYQSFTKEGLQITWIAAFSLIPLHLIVLLSGLLCSNHVNKKFGKGLPPKLYHVDYHGIIASDRINSRVPSTTSQQQVVESSLLHQRRNNNGSII